MKNVVWVATLSLFLAAVPAASKEEPTPKPTRKQKAEALQRDMEFMRDDYWRLLGDCSGVGACCCNDFYWFAQAPPDWEACKKAERLKKDYRRAYRELLQLDRGLVIFGDMPKHVDSR